MSYKIVTDSATDLPKEIIEKYKLHVIPTPVTINGTDYFDGKTILPADFYRIQAEGADIKTYHINQFMFRENFEPYAKAGEEVVYLCFSTGIAGTFNAANLAREELLEEYPDFRITIIDSKCASMGFGLGVIKLLEMQEKGAPKDLIVEAARFFFDHMEHIVTVDTLEYLYRGGRLSRTSAVLGGVLDLKPIIEVNDDGALVAIEKVRGRMKSLKRCVEIVGERGVNLEKQTIGLVHGYHRIPGGLCHRSPYGSRHYRNRVPQRGRGAVCLLSPVESRIETAADCSAFAEQRPPFFLGKKRKS